MNEFIQHIFYSNLGSDFNNYALLGFRLLLCFEMIRVHGLKKFGNEAEIVPNPLNLPTKINQILASFSDIVAPIFVAFGFATRLAVLPILGVTLIGYFVVHRQDSASKRDIPFMYSLCFLFILFVGAGKFSVDYYLFSILGN